MNTLKIWFMDVGHGDSAYIELPNEAKIMIDCGGYDKWPSKVLKYYKVTKTDNPVPLPNVTEKYGLDMLVISHPHGDHIADIVSIHDDIGFYLLSGAYRGFIDNIPIDSIDFKKRGQTAAKKFVEVVNKYCGDYQRESDRSASMPGIFQIISERFIAYEENIDLNEISFLTAISFYDHKVLFMGDLTKTGIDKILNSSKLEGFKNFVKGATVIKIAHHGRVNGCSSELFELIGEKPLLGIVSDETLNEINSGTSNVGWYDSYISDNKVKINGELQARKVLTTRKDKDIFMEFFPDGTFEVHTDCFSIDKESILNS